MYWGNLIVKRTFQCLQNSSFYVKIVTKNRLKHSHKKCKDIMEGSLDRLLFVAELEFPKILVPRLPHNTSNIDIECTGT